MVGFESRVGAMLASVFFHRICRDGRQDDDITINEYVHLDDKAMDSHSGTPAPYERWVTYVDDAQNRSSASAGRYLPASYFSDLCSSVLIRGYFPSIFFPGECQS